MVKRSVSRSGPRLTLQKLTELSLPNLDAAGRFAGHLICKTHCVFKCSGALLTDISALLMASSMPVRSAIHVGPACLICKICSIHNQVVDWRATADPAILAPFRAAVPSRFMMAPLGG